MWVSDFKTTSKSLDADSPFWDRLRIDSQISHYVLAVHDLHRLGGLRDFGIKDDEQIGGAFYDVVRKPSISPKTLSQADTAALVETGEYCGKKFVVKIQVNDQPNVFVNEISAVAEQGKKGFAIRETSEMYGARLLADIVQRPEFYFARREIARLDKDLAEYRRELWGIYQTIKAMRKGNWWFRSDQQDSIGLHGQYAPLCLHNVDVSDGHTPEGFKRR